MTKLNLGKIRMRFAGDYNAAAEYVPTDIIRDVATGDLYVPILAEVPAGTALTDAASFELFIAAPADGADGADAIGDLVAANNLSDLTDQAVARQNLGLGSAAIVSSESLATAAQGAKADAAMPKAGGDFTGPVKAMAVSEALVALAGAAPDMDLASATLFTLATAGAVTLTHSNPPAAAWVRTLVVTAGGADAITFPANWDWGDDGLPDPLATAGDVLEIAFRGEGASVVRASVSWRKSV
ncbi:hypothetical protein [Pseudophaeobacter sp.]|uniref:hypothetical protein n=1 Tax=Pseudophaeobacter sp. TaxID=1971739 RepID=UPI00329A2E35